MFLHCGLCTDGLFFNSKVEAGGRVSPEGIGDFFDDRLTVDLIVKGFLLDEQR